MNNGNVNVLVTYMRSCVILGSGRSGTSMLAGLLRNCGFFMGDSLLDPSSSNPKGYFESEDINRLNDQLIADVTSVRPKGPLGYLYPWRISPGLLWMADIGIDTTMNPTRDQIDRMRALSSKKPFCFKDPRFCYTLNAWHPMLNDAALLCVFREPGRTVASIKKDVHEQYPRERHWNFLMTTNRTFQAWRSMYMHVLEKHYPIGRWVFVHYDQIVDGSAIPRIEDAIDAEVDASFVDPALRRSRDLGELPEAVVPVYRRLCALADYAPPTPSPQ
jgi:hypothetical protein